MDILQWTGEVLALLILIGGAFLMGVSVSDRKHGKR